VRRMCRDKFQGMFSCDTLPPKLKLLVCNTNPHDKPGTHSMAVECNLTRSGWNLLPCLKTIWTNIVAIGHLTVKSYRVCWVISAVITVVFTVCIVTMDLTWIRLCLCLRRIQPSMMCLCISLFAAKNKKIENVNTWFILSNSHTIYKSDNQ
jgi:hypothetical protein